MGLIQLARNLRNLSTRSLENPTIGLNDPGAFDEFYGGGSRSEAGISVTANKALSIAAFWQGLSQISGDLARIPLLPHDISDENDIKIDKAHPSFRIIRRKANRERAAYFVWRDFWLHALIYNKAFLWINRSSTTGEPIELVNLLPDRTAPGRVGGSLYYETDINGEMISLRPDEVFHVQGPSIDWLEAPSLIRLARNGLGLALQAESFESKFFANGIRAGGYLMIPPHWTEKAAKNLDEGLLKKAGGGEWFRSVILRDGAKFEKASFSAQEMQMSEVRTEQVREVARWLNISPSRLGLDDATSYNSKSEDNRNYHDQTLSHWMAGEKAEAWDKLLSEEEKNNDSHEFRHDTSELLSMSELQRYQKHAIGVRTGIDTINEVRKVEGKSSLAWGDERLPQAGAPKPSAGPGDNGEGGIDKDDKNPGGEKTKEGEEKSGAETAEEMDLKKIGDAYASAVRSGLITPQVDDEQWFRDVAKLPVPGADVLKVWRDEVTRRPITLASAGQVISEPTIPEPTIPEPEEEGETSESAIPEPEKEEAEEDRDDPLRESRIAEKRIAFSLTNQARHKASRSSSAFLEWIDGGLTSLREESRNSIGNDQLVAEFHKRALAVVERAKTNELRDEVEGLCLELEKDIENE